MIRGMVGMLYLVIRARVVTVLAGEERAWVAAVMAAAPALAAEALVLAPIPLVRLMATVKALVALTVVIAVVPMTGVVMAGGRVVKVMEAVAWAVALGMEGPSTRSRCCRSSPRQRSSARTSRARATSTPPVSGRMSSRRTKHP